MGLMGGQRHTAGGHRKTQGIAYVLAMRWLGVVEGEEQADAQMVTGRGR